MVHRTTAPFRQLRTTGARFVPHKAWKVVLLFVVSLHWLCCPLLSRGADTSPSATSQSVVVRKIIGATGEVRVHRAGARPDAWDRVSEWDVLRPGDRIVTGPSSKVLLVQGTDTVRWIGPNSSAEIISPRGDLTLWQGLLYLFHRGPPDRFGVRSRAAFAGVRGTEFSMEVLPSGETVLHLIDGQVAMTNSLGESMVLESGTTVRAQPDGQLATARLESHDVNRTIQWTLYYPGVVYLGDLPGLANADAALAPSLDAYRAGDLPGALSAYPEDRAPASDDERLYRAAILLAIGRVADAESILDRLPGRSEPVAHALRKVIAAVRRKELESSVIPANASAWLAESYYQQSRADLEQARTAARRSVELAPEFAFALARLAEMDFSFGDTTNPLTAIERSLELAPRNAQAHAIKGFLLAARRSGSAAASAFEEAIRLDGSLSHGWLGQGLNRIRRGDLAGGRVDLLVAASAEPQRSLLRSYLGKAFADSRPFVTPAEAEKAAHELDLAKSLDPQDPTPWLYSALLNQQENRVRAAIADLEKSIELNENRALYRSRLLLDEDLAVRSANLASIYHDAGLSEVALNAASRAVDADYANFSAHLFLANAYNVLRDPSQITLRYETPWFSEFLLANLLAPPGAQTLSQTVSQNEYSPLFEQRRLGLSSHTDYTSNGDWFQAASQYGFFGRTDYALDVTYRSVNGQRLNADQEETVLSASLRHQVDADDRVFFQVLYSDAERGDLRPTYDWEPLSPELRVFERQEPIILAGWHHQWHPGSHTLVLASFLQDDLIMTDPANQVVASAFDPSGAPAGTGVGTAGLTYQSELRGGSIEAQQIWSTERNTVVAGARFQGGEFDTTTRLAASDTIFLFQPDGSSTFIRLPASEQEATPEFYRLSLYLYDYWQITTNITLTAGVSYDRLETPVNFRMAPVVEGKESHDQISPKIGITLNPWRNGEIRASYGRSLGGVAFDQSIRLEPVQVAGLVHSYRGLLPEALVGSVAAQEFEIAGVAFEQRIRRDTFLTLAAEWLHADADRNLGVFETEFSSPPVIRSGTAPQHLDYDEVNFTASLRHLLGEYLVLGASYRLSIADLDITSSGFDGPAQTLLNTDQTSTLHQARLSLGINHPSGFFALMESLWTHQHNEDDAARFAGDDFWHLNARVGWRFLQRRLELSAALLNLTDEDYHLHPLNLYHEAYRERTLALSCRFRF